jgi:hypothetical protein
MLRALLALWFLALFSSVGLAQAPIPALPDSARQTSYSITSSLCTCAVGFQLYGDGTDYQNWLEVSLNGIIYSNTDPTFGWTLTSPSGTLSTLARPINDAIITFNSPQTGTVIIVSAQRPRRLSVFSENQGVTAHALNQVINTIFAILRDVWDKINDFDGRGIWGQPGSHFSALPGAAQCQNSLLSFGANGTTPSCVITPGLSGTSIFVAVRSSNAATVTVSATADYFLCLDPSNNTIFVNLPAGARTGLNYIIKDCTGTSSFNHITVQTLDGSTIDGFPTYTIVNNYQSLGVINTGGGWSLN